LPRGTSVEGGRLDLLEKRPNGDLYRASSPGVGRVEHAQSQMSNYLRVARAGYQGRGMFRHEEETDE
jgi:hypothetical protein